MTDFKRNAIVIGVTGGIACGKSEVGRILGEMGFTVCDADCVAHDLMGKGTPVFQKMIEHFGERIIGADGEIARPILGKIVFEDSDQRDVLNRLVHPAVRENLANWIGKMRSEGKPSAVLLPLLFESGMQNLDWDAVICVSSPESDVFQRLEKRGLTPEEAEKRVHSQMPLAEKEGRADLVVPNIGTLRELELATRETVNAIVERVL
ncbi:MAG: dephospho-CoA kinase [Kiritimatiellaceae bacterium]|nr:dephospho-CoA kinase [Kiritimatiellaceae bacterium]